MTPNEYIEACRKFDNHKTGMAEAALALGLASEAGEVANEFERGMRVGRGVDYPKVYLELGDVLWQIARLCDIFGWSFEGLMEQNIKKLTERYEREGIPNRDDR